jgi:uncharacterized repeat protein (TIGR04052 family)
VRFKAKLGAQDFACGTPVTLGHPATTYRPRDLRLYLSEVKLLKEDGSAVPVTLTDDGTWQGQGVALLDFEDATGDCDNGTSATNTTLRFNAPDAAYSGLAFTLGVPFAQNHQDATAAAPPLNSTALFWTWMLGYKFLRAEGLTTGLPTGHDLHLGSTACVPGPTPNSVDHCDHPNRVAVTLPHFDVKTDTVLVDVGAVLDGSDLDTNAADTASGCQSSQSDADCAPIFHRLGLPFGSEPGDPSAQVLFRKE